MIWQRLLTRRPCRKCFAVYSTRQFVLCLALCHFVLVFFSPFSIAITSLGKERANLRAFCTFVRFVLVWICRFPLPLGVLEGLRFVIVALPGLFSYFFYSNKTAKNARYSNCKGLNHETHDVSLQNLRSQPFWILSPLRILFLSILLLLTS